MALVADIQLQNGSVIPSKLDTDELFTVGAVSASVGFFAGPTIPNSLSGLLTLKTANDTEAWFQTTKVDGDVNLYLNNDSDTYWRMSLSGAAPPNAPTEGAADSLLIQKGADPSSPSIFTHLSITPDGNIGIGTSEPKSSSILDIITNDSSSADVRIYNTTSLVDMRMYAGTAEGVIETTSPTVLRLKSNTTSGIEINTAGNVGIAGAADATTYQLKVTGSSNITSNLDVGGALEVISTLDVGADTTITGNVLPAADSTHDIGTNLVRWRHLYADDITITNGIANLIDNEADNRITTSNGDGSFNAEANLTFDGSELNVVGDIDFSGNFYQGGVLLGHWTDSSGDIYRSSNVGIGHTDTLIESWKTGSYLTISDSTDAGHLQINSAVADGDDSDLGSISFSYGANSATHKVVSVIESVSDGTTTNQRGGALKFYTKPDGSTTPLPAMFISQSGRVGISTLEPTRGLDVNSQVVFSPDTAGKETHLFTTNGTDNGKYEIKANTTPVINLEANGTSYLNGGPVSIGHTATSSSLSVKSSVTLVTSNNSTYAVSLGNDAITDLSFGSDASNSYIESFTKTLNINGQGSGNILFDTNTLYIDVTNDNVGIGTAPNALYALDVAGDINFTGELLANGNSFVTNNTNNYIMTGVGDGTLNGESNLTFDGTLLTITGNLNVTGNTDLTSIFPLLDSTYNLGSTSLRWANIYVDSIGDTGQALNITSGANNINVTAGTLVLTGAQTVSDTLGVTNLLTASSGIQTGADIVSDTDSTDSLGTNLIRFANIYVDTLGDNGQDLGVAATTLSFDTAATIDTSGSNQLDINTGTANLAITAANTTMSGDLTVDTTTLVVDSTNNNVGVGTAPNSLYALDVTGDINYTGDLYLNGTLAVFSNWTNNSTYIYRDSEVGIGQGFGSITPAAELEIRSVVGGDQNLLRLSSDVFSALTPAAAVLQYGLSDSSQSRKVAGEIKVGNDGTWNYATASTVDAYMSFETIVDDVLAERMRIHTNGFVGINQNTPAYTLDVDGDINFTGDLYENGVQAVFSNWIVDGSDIYRSSNVGIGSSSIDIQTWRAGSKLTIDDATTRGQLELNSPIADAAGANLGSILFSYSTNSATHKTLGIIELDTEGTTVNQRGGKLKFFTKEDGVATPAVRMVINESGNVGVGVENPLYKLHVVGDINFTGALYENGTQAQFSNWTINGSDIYRTSNVGIGITNPTERLEVGFAGNTAITINNTLNSVSMKLSSDATAGTISTTTDHPIEFKVNDTLIGTVDSDGIDLEVGKTYRIDGVPLSAGGGSGGGAVELTAFAINWPNNESTSYNAHKIYFIDITDPLYCWDFESSKRDIRNKSWYNELTMPPTHGMLVISADQSSLRWINRSYESDGTTYFQQYMSFSSGVNDIIPSNINDVKFLDFKIYVSTANGLIIIDLIQDKAYKIDNSGHYIYNGNITQRNDGLGWLSINPNFTINNLIVNSFDVTRDIDGQEDVYTRPLHYWAAATPSGVSFHRPSASNAGDIYPSLSTTPSNKIKFLNKTLAWNIDDTEDQTLIINDYETILAGSWSNDSSIRATAANPYEKSFFSTAAVLSDVDGVYTGDNVETFVIGSDEGLSIRRSVSGEIGITNTFATPYMNEGRKAAYTLKDLEDVSGNSPANEYDLTNVGTAAFTGLSPFGVACVNLDGVDDILRITGQSGFGEATNISFYMKSSSSTNPNTGNKEIINVVDGGSVAGKISIYTQNNTGKIGVTISDDFGSTSDSLLSDGDFYDGNWHHVYFGKVLGDNSNWHLYIDGYLSFTVAITNATGTFSFDDLRIGADNTDANNWAGEVSQLVITDVPFTEGEITLEYGRMQAGLAGGTTLLTAADVDSIESDSDSGYSIVTAGNSAHLLDAKTGLMYTIDAVGAGNLNHADIKSLPEANTPHYLLGGSTSIEQIAPETTVLNGGIPKTDSGTNGISDLTAFSISWPEKVSTNYDADKIYFVDLNDSKYCWDFEYVKRDGRNKSWHTTTPPTNGFLVVDAAQNILSWINRSYEADGVAYFTRYKNFVANVNNIISANIVDVRFLDFKIYVATDTDGICVIDLFQDKGFKINSSGYYMYSGNINEANDSLGWVQLTTDVTLVSDNCTSFDVVRDPESKEDIYSRPFHYWAVGTDTGTSLFRPTPTSIGNVYDSSDTTSVIDVEFANTSLSIAINDTEDRIIINEDFLSIGGGAWTTTIDIRPTPANPYEETFYSTAAVISDTSSLLAPNNIETLMVGTNEGLSIRRSLSGEIGITSNYVTPYMNEERIAAYPLNDVNDRGGNGYNLTNNGITFTQGPVGFAAVGDGSTTYMENTTASVFDVDLTWSFSFYMASNDATIPAGNTHAVEVGVASVQPTITFYIASSAGADPGSIGIRWDDFAGTNLTLFSPSSVYDTKWHSIVGTSDGTTLSLYVDGVLVDTVAVGGMTDVDFAQSGLGLFSYNFGTSGFFNGKIQQLLISDSPMSYDEVSLHYSRMQAGLGGATALLTSDSVDAIEVDPDSGYAIVAAGNVAHIMDAQTGLMYSTDLVDSGVLRHVDILSMSDSLTPHYLMGASTSIEQVAPNTRVLNGGIPITGEESDNSSDLTAFAISWPEKTSTDYDAHKIYFSDLKDSRYCWDWDEAKRNMRNKSWYNELGLPPTHGFVVVDGSQNSLQWVSRSYGTDGISYFGSFMLFVAGGSNIVSDTIIEVKFVDLKMYVTTDTDGVCIIDFLQDKAYKINANGYYIYNSNISDRNAGSGWTQISTNLSIVNSNTTSIDAIRDPFGSEDVFARPLHYWAIGSDFGVSLFKPSSGTSGTIYDSSNTNPVYDVSFVGQSLTWTTNETNDTTNIARIYTNISADAWVADSTINSTKTDWTQTFFSGTAVLTDLGSSYGARGENILLIGSNEGLSIRTDILDQGKEVGITQSYVTPLMKGDRVAAYPLNDLNDRSGNGKTLTDGGTTTFTTGVFQNAATFDGSTDYLYRTADNSFDMGTGDFTISLFCKSSTNGVPAADEFLVRLQNAADTIYVVLFYDLGTGYIRFVMTDDDGVTSDGVISPQDIYDGQWHHVVGVREGSTLRLYIDGIEVATDNINSSVDPMVMDELYIGSGNASAHFDGKIANLSIQKTSWTSIDVEFEHNRMISALAGNVTTLTASDVDTIEVDKESGYAIITAGDNAHIMDTKSGLFYSVDPLGVGNLNHADILSLPESNNPHYLLGGSSAIEQVAPQTTVLNGGVPTTSNTIITDNIINPFFLMGA